MYVCVCLLHNMLHAHMAKACREEIIIVDTLHLRLVRSTNPASATRQRSGSGSGSSSSKAALAAASVYILFPMPHQLQQPWEQHYQALAMGVWLANHTARAVT